MPDEQNAGVNGAGGDGSAGAGDAGANTGNPGTGEETVTVKKSEWEKTTNDLNNYREALLVKKANERAGNEGKGEAGTDSGTASTTIDEKTIDARATAAATTVQKTASQRAATQDFIRKHPEYLGDDAWKTLMEHTTFRGSELTQGDYLDRLESGMYEHLRVTGKLEEHLNKAREEGRDQGRIEGTVNASGGSGAPGDRTHGTGANQGGLTPAGRDMAARFKVDPEKADKIDPSKDNVISISSV